MKFGFFMMPIHIPTESPVLSFDRDLEMIQWAEDMDYDEFYVGEHHTAAWEPIPCPEMFLAKASAFTKNIKLNMRSVFNHLGIPIICIRNALQSRRQKLKPASRTNCLLLFKINPYH